MSLLDNFNFVLDGVILPVLLALGVFGNAFMLWLICGWVTSAHPKLNPCLRIKQAKGKLIVSSSNVRPTFNTDMCMYMAALAMADLGQMVMVCADEYIAHVGCGCRWKSIIVKTCANSFKGTNKLFEVRYL